MKMDIERVSERGRDRERVWGIEKERVREGTL